MRTDRMSSAATSAGSRIRAWPCRMVSVVRVVVLDSLFGMVLYIYFFLIYLFIKRTKSPCVIQIDNEYR